MKKLFIGFFVIASFSSFAQSIDWSALAERSAVVTDLEFCFKNVLDGKTKSNCRNEMINASKVGVTRDEASAILYKVSKYKVLAAEAAIKTDKELEVKIQELVEDKELEALILNH